MSTYAQIQIVFFTKNRKMRMTEPGQEKVYRYIWGILINNTCHLYRIGGMEDHLQLVTHIHPTVAAANLIKDIKLATSE